MNHVVLMGRLVRDPETKITNNQQIVTNFTLAVDRGYKKPDGTKEADFINCVAFNKRATFIDNYFEKGKMMVLNGRIQTRTWDDTDGKKRYATEVVAEEVYFGDSKTTTQAEPQEQEGFFPVDMDDELPF